MEYFFQLGADIIIFSAHKFMGSLTAGIIAGKKEICKKYLSSKSGIGRGMKVGKEAIFAQ